MFQIGQLKRLGEAPGAVEVAPGGFPNWLPDAEPAGDADLIAIEYYSPDANYPPKRIANYDVPLAQHQTLNGVPSILETVQWGGPFIPGRKVDVPALMRLPAYERGFLGAATDPRWRVREGAPRGINRFLRLWMRRV